MNQNAVDLQQAIQLHLAGRLGEAATIYQQALAIDSNHAEAWHLLGVVLHQTGRSEEGAGLIQRAISIQPNVASYHNNLGEALRELDRSDEAIASFRRALALKPLYPQAFNNLGVESGRMGRMAESVQWLSRCIAANPNDAEAHWNLAMALLVSGEWDRGWQEFEWRHRKPGNTVRVFRQPIWNGQPLAGKTILVWSEQGLGDTLQFFRFVSRLKLLGARVLLEVQPALVSLLAAQHVADGVYCVGEGPGDFDFHLSMMSLARVMRTTVQTVPNVMPYLHAPGNRKQYWAERLKQHAGRKVGIARAGNPNHPNDQRRSMPASALAGLGTVAGITFVTVQPRSAEQSPLPGLQLIDLGAELVNFADTAGLISQLDLLVSVDTSVAHLAGALDVPTWLMLPYSPDWRWLMHRENTVWYRSMKLFRQMRVGDWEAVVERVARELEAGVGF